MGNLSKKQKKMLRRILIAAALLVILAVAGPRLSIPLWPLYLIPYAVIGWDVL